MDDTKIKKSRRSWTREETLALINCYSNRKDEMVNSKKKSHVYSNILEDLIYLGILKNPATPVQIENKMSSLLKAFKSARDNNCQTGAAACVVPFMTEMEDLFGDRPMMSSNHSIGISRGKQTSQTISPDSHSLLLIETSPSSSPHLLMSPSVSKATGSASPRDQASQERRPLSTLQPLGSLEQPSQARRPEVTPSSPLSSKKRDLLRPRKTIKENLFLKELGSRERIAATREEGRNRRFKEKMELVMKLEESKAKRAAAASKESAEMFLAAQVAQVQLYKDLLNKNK